MQTPTRKISEDIVYNELKWFLREEISKEQLFALVVMVDEKITRLIQDEKNKPNNKDY